MSQYLTLSGTILAERFLIKEQLGQGGNAFVYLAQELESERWVAIKHLTLGAQLQEFEKGNLIKRFLIEANLMQSLSHPHIMTVYEHFEIDGHYFMVMEYLKGLTLKEIMNRTQLGHRELLILIEQVLGALEYAHGQRIVHRDIKPDNIMVIRQNNQIIAKLLDFGIARLEFNQQLTTDGALLGTIAYMSPEQLQNSHNITHQTDIYSIGIVLYELFTHQLPYVAENPGLAILQILGQEPVSPIDHNSAVGQDINQIILACMSKYPHHRFASCHLLQKLIQELIQKGYSQGVQPDAQSEPCLPKIREFEEFRFLELLETLLEKGFSGSCCVWNAFQEGELYLRQGKVISFKSRNMRLDILPSLADIVCWQAGNFYLQTDVSPIEDELQLETPILLPLLKESFLNFKILWEDYHDYDLPEKIAPMIDLERFSPVAREILPILDSGLCIGQIYTLLPYTRTDILKGIKELEDRQYIFIERIRD